MAVAVTTIISWAIGFQHNETVAINQIMDEQVQHDIVSFNQTVEAIDTLSVERTTLSSKIKNSHDASLV